MSDHYNKLTPAEAERLAMLAEECAEVIQIVGKVLRHGYESCHPNGGEDNRTLLETEITDLRAVILAMVACGDISLRTRGVVDTWERKLQYTHHQAADHENG